MPKSTRLVIQIKNITVDGGGCAKATTIYTRSNENLQESSDCFERYINRKVLPKLKELHTKTWCGRKSGECVKVKIWKIVSVEAGGNNYPPLLTNLYFQLKYESNDTYTVKIGCSVQK